MPFDYSRYARPAESVPAARNWFLIVNLVLALFLGAVSLIIEVSNKPPVACFDDASRAVSQARQLQAAVYAPDQLRMAESYLEQARLLWAAENQRWMFRRDFSRATAMTQKANDMAEYATMRATTLRDSLRWVAATGINLTRKRIADIRAQFLNMPMDSHVRQTITFSELAIMESEAAFKRGDFRRAVVRYQVAAKNIGSAGDEVTQILNGYFVNVPKWRKWVQQTLRWSVDNNSVVILVDKLAHRCQVYRKGTKTAEFPVELGPNWLGHKRQRGDGATPEGLYRIKRKKSGHRTAYYKALEIDYPNAEDIAQFNAAKARGEIARSAGIGGLIEVHGDGGKGANWTAGCVALRNRDMDTLYNMVEEGTPITIVGSLRSISTSALDTAQA
ncbi:MAG TPA: L,D-transpeptidase family protein, partial [bacterium]|nr:L,D-transpeptidase family protein [bacterium]